MSSHWIDHRGTRIFYGDLRDLQQNLDAIRQRLARYRTEVEGEPVGSVLVLVDLRGTTTSLELLDVLREQAGPVNDRFRRRAVVVPPIQVGMAEALARHWPAPVAICDSLERAKELLVAEG